MRNQTDLKKADFWIYRKFLLIYLFSARVPGRILPLCGFAMINSFRRAGNWFKVLLTRKRKFSIIFFSTTQSTVGRSVRIISNVRPASRVSTMPVARAVRPTTTATRNYVKLRELFTLHSSGRGVYALPTKRHHRGQRPLPMSAEGSAEFGARFWLGCCRYVRRYFWFFSIIAIRKWVSRRVRRSVVFPRHAVATIYLSE